MTKVKRFFAHPIVGNLLGLLFVIAVVYGSNVWRGTNRPLWRVAVSTSLGWTVAQTAFYFYRRRNREKQVEY